MRTLHSFSLLAVFVSIFTAAGYGLGAGIHEPAVPYLAAESRGFGALASTTICQP